MTDSRVTDLAHQVLGYRFGRHANASRNLRGHAFGTAREYEVINVRP
ncbi:hypothetical protein [Brevundimonas denitrificans]|nr:hypothetical protein [Brevundimonas denitrificans]